MRRLVVCLAVSGCWAEEPLVDNTFTSDEWEFLSTQFVLPEPQLCPDELAGDPDTCRAAARFGQALFFEPALSGLIVIDDPAAPARPGEIGKVSCETCHATYDSKTDTVLFFTDTHVVNNISLGARATKHNALSVVNTAYKSAIASEQCAGSDASYCAKVYTWNAAYDTPAGVITQIAGPKAMNTNEQIVTEAICANGSYFMTYAAIFGASPSGGSCPAVTGPTHAPAVVNANVGLALDAYTRQLTSVDSPFDRYIAGTVASDRTTSNRSELTDQQRRGLALFIGKAMCVDCHRGPLLSDLQFHNTGVPQIGARVPAIDLGLGGEANAMMPPGHDGEFLTPSLRHVTETAPYMHAGQFQSLAQVIEFYRAGGVPDGFSGRKDPRIQPLEIDDDAARDLEAFLAALRGKRIDKALATRPQ